MSGSVLIAAIALQLALPANEPSHELHPGWSPDGEQIVFQSNLDGDDELYVLHLASGRLVKLTDNEFSDEQPQWSPDGKEIAFSSDRSGTPGIYIIKSDGSGLRTVIDGPEKELRPNWSPDSSLLVYDMAIGGQWKLFTVSRNGGEPKILTDHDGDHLSGAFTPDGKQVGFGRADAGGNHDSDISLWTVKIDGTDYRRLESFPGGDSNIRYSPNGERIVFNSIRDGNWEIYVAEADGEGQQRLTSDHTPEKTFDVTTIDGQPAWAPDGRRIAFTSGRNGDFDIVILTLDGDAPLLRNVTKQLTKTARE